MNSPTKVLALTGLVMIALSFTSMAQVSLSVHIGNPPYWAPREHASQIRYYYLPEMDCYYDAQREGYYYPNGNSWSFYAHLPSRFARYNFNRGPKIELNYFGGRPFDYFQDRRDGYYREYHRGDSQYEGDYEHSNDEGHHRENHGGDHHENHGGDHHENHNGDHHENHDHHESDR